MNPIEVMIIEMPMIGLSATCLITAVLTFIIISLFYRRKFGNIQNKVDSMMLDAHKEADIIKKEADLEAKNIILKTKNDLEKELQNKRNEANNIEKRLLSKEEVLEKKYTSLERKENDFLNKEERIMNTEKELASLERELKNNLNEQKEKLLHTAGLTEQEARERVLSNLKEELATERSQMVRKAEAEAKIVADRKARNVLVLAIQRQALDQCQEHATKLIPIPSDEMKGRIIGREGRNIRAFEQACGVDLIIDDTPDAILISCFDPVRRHIAKTAMDKLLTDGRVHPARIEEIVEKVRKTTGSMIREAGENAVLDLGVTGVHPEIMKLLGQLQFRTSYGQQQLLHSIEVAQLAGVMADELRVDVKLAKRAGILHDIGKAVTHEIEGSHAMIGADILKKYGESAEVEHAVRAHHQDVEPRTVLAFLTDAADAMSGGRPGARSKTEASYIQRLERLEEICMSFQGVQRSYAVQAGRDVRIMVDPRKVNDDNAILLARDITRKIEDEMQFPGQIKVSVIRELRAVDYAK